MLLPARRAPCLGELILTTLVKSLTSFIFYKKLKPRKVKRLGQGQLESSDLGPQPREGRCGCLRDVEGRGEAAKEKGKKAEKMEVCGDRKSMSEKQMTWVPMSYAQ